MSLVPVLDIKDGEVVAGVEGRRDEYEPVNSQIADSADPLDVVEAFEKHYRFDTIYIADIDALEGEQNNFETVKDLSEQFEIDIMLDLGYSKFEDIDTDIFEYIDNFIVASESLKSTADLDKLIEVLGRDKIIASIDFSKEKFRSDMEFDSPSQFLDIITERGISEIIILDVSQVGTENGISDKVIKIADETKESFDLISGGGIRTDEHYLDFIDKGIDKVLVSTCLHKKSLNMDEI